MYCFTHISLTLFFSKVFDSSEESGYLVLTIVISGHFFISQGQTLLVGFMHTVLYGNIFIYLCSFTLIFVPSSFFRAAEIHHVQQIKHLSMFCSRGKYKNILNIAWPKGVYGSVLGAKVDQRIEINQY